jgi:uncharacterized protein (DUF697 family)
MKLPVDVRALYDQGKRLKEDREKPVSLAVLVEIDAPDELVEAAKDELHPKTANAMVDVAAIEPGYTMKVAAKADAAIVLMGSGTHIGPTLAALKEHAIPTAVVALRAEKAVLARLVGHPENDVVVGTDAYEIMRGPLAEWAMTRLESKRQALGHNFEFMRRAVAKEIVKSTAWQNAAIGVVFFVPGADMPLMTLNQGKMLLQIAAAYGQPLDAERIKELTVVVGGGFLFRTFAREMIAFIPGLGWAIKGAVAYTGTQAMGTAAIRYFEQGADLSGVLHALTDKASETAKWAASHVKRGKGGRLEVDYVETAPALPAADAQFADVPPRQPALLDVPAAEPTLAPLAETGGLPGASTPS